MLKLENLYLNLEPAFFTPLLAKLLSVVIFLIEDCSKFVDMFFVLSLLPDPLSGLSSQLLQALLKLFALLLPFLFFPSKEFLVQFFWSSPLLPCKLFNLITHEEHYIIPCRLMRVWFEHVW